MKKSILLLGFLVCAYGLIAQPTYTVNPPSFTAEDEITITVNVSKTTLKDYAGDVWMWAWISEGCSANCDAPTNKNPAGGDDTADAKMTRDASDPNVYSITIVPSVFYNKPPSEIKKIGFKLKSADWNDGKQTDSDVLINVDPLVFVPKVNRIFPTKVTKEDAVTLYLDQSVATNPDLKYAVSDFTVSIKAYDENDVEIGSIEDADVVNAGDGLHYIRIIPTFSFGVSEINSIRYRFTAKDADVASDEFSLVFFK
jgi:hypothetical protein